MRVSQVNDHVTHAVIGGATPINFGISDSPEFFNILSSTLYTDQKLAVVRETLCNAWDAHIENNCTNKAVEVTVRDGYMIIRDYGTGIPKNLIGQIYGTYGGSTKKDNKGVTGGFGLGCKAPFAYADHFEVTSWNGGFKTIYNLSKSNVEVGGKPSIMEIISVKTDETGLQVKIPIQTHDVRTFTQRCERIIANGQMNMTLNGMVVETIPFEKAKHNFIITKNSVVDSNHQILIRYGHVIYPIENDPLYRDEYTKIINFLGRLDGRYGYDKWKVILQAEPDSISVTPSREALSNQKHTIASIKILFEKFLETINKNLDSEIDKILEQSIKDVWLSFKPKYLFETTSSIPGLSETLKSREIGGKYLTEFNHFSRHYALNNYPSRSAFREKDINLRIQSMLDANFGNKNAIEAFKKEYAEEKTNRPTYEDKTNKLIEYGKIWFTENITKPIISKMNEDSGVKPANLMVKNGNRNRWSSDEQFITLDKMDNRILIDYLPFLRNIIVISFNRRDVIERARHFPIMEEQLGSVDDCLVYITPRAPKKVELARKFFTDLGMIIIDLTKAHEWEDDDAAAPIIPVYEKTPKKEGLPPLQAIMNLTGQIATSGAFDASVKRIKEFEFVTKFSRKNCTDTLDNQTNHTTKLILDLFGSKGAIISNANQAERYKKEGIPIMEDYIWAKILEQYNTNTRIREFAQYDFTRLDSSGYNPTKSDRQYIFQIIFADQDLKDYFGFKDDTNETDKKYIRLGKHFKSMYIHGYTGCSDKLNIILKTLPLDPSIKTIDDKIRKSVLFGTIDPSEILKIMQDRQYIGNPIRNKLRDFVLEVIEG